MGDFDIVKDEYFYIKERAFKDIGGVKETGISKAIKEDEGKAGQGRGEAGSESKPEKEKGDKGPESRHLKCPLHSCDMKTVYLDTILIDYCPECYGIWLDFGELEKLVKKSIEKNQLFRDKFSGPVAEQEEVNRIIKCPVCQKTLTKKKHYSSNLYIDICSVCGGIWFDSGEFAAIYMDNRESSSIQNILAGVLGNYIDIKA
jgi:Zn-finger nucleic acid-binding protein